MEPERAESIITCIGCGDQFEADQIDISEWHDGYCPKCCVDDRLPCHYSTEDLEADGDEY